MPWGVYRLVVDATGTRTVRRRPDGTWAPIELGLTTSGGGRIGPKLAPYRISFAPSAADGILAAVAVDDAHEVAFGLRSASHTRQHEIRVEVTHHPDLLFAPTECR
jgi:hypothetical protein